MSEPGLILRASVGSDLNFIRRTWLSGLRELPNGLPDEQWWPAHRAYVEAQLFSAANKILIAGASDDPHEILGWAVASKDVLEWVHVRKGLRAKGLAGVLLRNLGFSPDGPPQTRWRNHFASSHLTFNFSPWELRK